MSDAGLTDLLSVLVSLSSIVGLAVGSFLNVVIYRVPQRLSLVAPPSACPRCGAGIAAYDNIPVISWIILRGRCRSCRVSISLRYPLVEVATALIFAGTTWWAVSGWGGDDSPFGPALTSGWSIVAIMLALTAFLYLGALSLALTLIDLDTHRLPNGLVLPGYIVGSVCLTSVGLILGDYDSIWRAAIGMAILWGCYFMMALAYPGGMGLGDVKLAGLLGIFLGYLGWEQLAVGAFAAFLLGGLYAAGLLAARRVSRTSGIPFGPWMLAGAWIGILFGTTIWRAYLGVLGMV